MWLQKTLLTHFSVSPSTAVRRETSLSSMIDVKWSTRSFPVFFFFLLFPPVHSPPLPFSFSRFRRRFAVGGISVRGAPKPVTEVGFMFDD